MKIEKHPYQMTEIRAIDSDTIIAWVQIDRETRHQWRIRLKGVEGGEAGTAAGFVGLRIISEILHDKQIMSAHFFGNVNCKDKYGRHVGDVKFEDGSQLCYRLMASGHFWKRDRSGKEHKPQPA